MESIGAEVGQKMRSAIKAKLLELDCYVDDELPDYIMVMVANKRSKSQMTEDLNLFLSKKTSAFVNWLHIVLKKLKEVSVTNPEVYKKVIKRKSVDTLDNEMKEKKIKHANDVKQEYECEKSLTDNLPITAIHFGEKKEKNLEIPLFTAANPCSKDQLEEIEKRISLVKSRLGEQVENEELNFNYHNEMLQVTTRQQITDNYRTVEVQDDNVDIPKSLNVESPQCEDAIKFPEYEDIDRFPKNKIEILFEKKKHSPITFESDKIIKRISVQDRLGEKIDDSKNKKSIRLSEFRKEEGKFLGYHQGLDGKEKFKNKEKFLTKNRSHSPNRKTINKIKSGIFKLNKFKSPINKNGLTRLEVMSKIYVPLKQDNEPEELNKREVKSVVQVKPRVIPADAPQPNKNLLLKAMAEAQKSIVQASKPRTVRLENESLLRKENLKCDTKPTRKLLECDKSKLKNMILSNLPHNHDNVMMNELYIPKVIEQDSKEASSYIPSLKSLHEAEHGALKEEKILPENEFIIQNVQNKHHVSENSAAVISGTKKSAKLRLQRRKSPSPIFFEKVPTKVTMKTNAPERSLSLVRTSIPLRIKERCKYWPTCRQGEKCEFVHPNTNCDNFPHCKFGDKCLYLHPFCKFGSSCTKRNCPFSHVIMPVSPGSRVFPYNSAKHLSSQLQTCKYFPNCVNQRCPFYHPHSSKCGKYFKNSMESSGFLDINPNLTWRSK